MRFGAGAALLGGLLRGRLGRGLGRRLCDGRSLDLGRLDGSLGLLRGLHLGRLGRARARASASAAGPAASHRAEALAVGTAAAFALAEAFTRATGAAAAARLVLVAEPQLTSTGQPLEALGHDLALVDPDLDADP